MAGARRVQKNLLEKHPTSDLQVYVVWFSMIPTDARAAWRWTGNVITDERVTHFWDAQKVVGRWYAAQDNPGESDPGVVWDAYYFYDPDAEWNTKPEPLRVRGATVLDEFDNLEKSLAPLLR